MCVASGLNYLIMKLMYNEWVIVGMLWQFSLLISRCALNTSDIYTILLRASRASSIDRQHRRNAIALDSVLFFSFFFSFYDTTTSATQQIVAEKNRTVYTVRAISIYIHISLHLFCFFTSRAGTSCERSLDRIFQ